MTVISKSAALTRSAEVRDERTINANTATRVGGLFVDIVDSVWPTTPTSDTVINVADVDGDTVSAALEILDGLIADLSGNIGDLVPGTRQVIAGAGLTGGGSLSSNVTIDVGTTDNTIVTSSTYIRVGTITDANIANQSISVMKLAGGTDPNVLLREGAGPVWGQILNSHIASNAGIAQQKIVNGTTGYVLAGGAVSNSWVKITNSHVSDTAAVAVSKLAPGAATGDVLTTQAGVPTWSKTFPWTTSNGGMLTISNGAITPTATYHTLYTEAGAAQDTLESIVGGVDGQWLMLGLYSSSYDVTIQHGSIVTWTGADVEFGASTGSLALLFCRNATWMLLAMVSSGFALQVAKSIIPRSDATYGLGDEDYRWLDAHLSSYLAVGTNPAASGAIRLAYAGDIIARNGDDDGDVIVASMANDGRQTFGSSIPVSEGHETNYLAGPLKVGLVTDDITRLTVETDHVVSSEPLVLLTQLDAQAPWDGASATITAASRYGRVLTSRYHEGGEDEFASEIQGTSTGGAKRVCRRWRQRVLGNTTARIFQEAFTTLWGCWSLRAAGGNFGFAGRVRGLMTVGNSGAAIDEVHFAIHMTSGQNIDYQFTTHSDEFTETSAFLAPFITLTSSATSAGTFNCDVATGTPGTGQYTTFVIELDGLFSTDAVT